MKKKKKKNNKLNFYKLNLLMNDFIFRINNNTFHKESINDHMNYLNVSMGINGDCYTFGHLKRRI